MRQGTWLIRSRVGHSGRQRAKGVSLARVTWFDEPKRHTGSYGLGCAIRAFLNEWSTLPRMPSLSRDGEQGATVSCPTQGETMAAKKDKQARRLARKRKAQRRTPSSGQQILLNRVRASQHFHNTQVMVNPTGTEKMSEVILRFAAPCKDHDGPVPRAMIEIAIIMWNASFMPSDMQRKAVEDVVNVLPSHDSEARREMLRTAHMLLERKKQHFSDNKRMIMDYHITESAHGIHLDVVSTVPEEYTPAL